MPVPAGQLLPPRLRFHVAHALLDSPRLGQPYMSRRRGYRAYVIDPDTDVVIDGFPRSANTYALYAFQQAVGPDVHVSGHTHAAATVLTAVARGLPCLLVARRPRDSLASLQQHAPRVPLRTLIRANLRFHSRVLPVRDRLVVAEFDEVTRDFGAVMRRLNEHARTTFPPYVHTDANERDVFGTIEAASRRRNAGQVREAGVARPSSTRRAPDDVLAGASSRDLALLERADGVYDRLLHGA